MEKKWWIVIIVIILLLIVITTLSFRFGAFLGLPFSPDRFGVEKASTEAESCFSALESFDGDNLNKIRRLCRNLNQERAVSYAESEGVVAGYGSGETCSLGADFDGDGQVKYADLLILLSHWGETGEDLVWDLSGNGKVDFADLLVVLSRWGDVIVCTECVDGVDNEFPGDEMIDADDPGCWDDPLDSDTYNEDLDDESRFTSQCQDGIDNDDDDLIDFPADPGCGNKFVNTEVEQFGGLGTKACNDGVDNDNDGLIDWGYGDNQEYYYCSNPEDNSEQDVYTGHEEIRWDDFPDFSLQEDLVVVWNGLAMTPTQYYPDREEYEDVALRRGASHLTKGVSSQEVRDELLPTQRADVWSPSGSHLTHGAPVDDEPWATDSSPWNNDEQVLLAHWESEINDIADAYSDTRGTGVPNVEFIGADIERHWREDTRILDKLKDNPVVPEEIRSLDNDSFVDLYKRDMSRLYDYSASYPERVVGSPSKLSAYSDSPIERIIWKIPLYSWDEWATNIELVNWLLYDYTDPGPGFYENLGPFSLETQDFLSPSGYYFDKYPSSYEEDSEMWIKAGRQLAYNLFMIDANRLWFDQEKPILIYQWMRYHGSGNCRTCGLDPWMAHNSAIFPFFSENTGIWVWDWDGFKNFTDSSYPWITDVMQGQNRIAYDNFIYGMQRLSEYNEFFEGDYEVYHPDNARDLFRDELPVWRGVIKADRTEMLIVAHNPYSNRDEITSFWFSYEGRALNPVPIRVHGLNTWLGVCGLQGGGCVGDEGDVFE